MIHTDLHNWLESEYARPCILVEVAGFYAGSEHDFYFSDVGYVSDPSDTPANLLYEAVVANVGTIRESLSIDGTPRVSSGEIAILNVDGELDHLLDYVWANRGVNVYFGDVSWVRSDFRQIYSGIVEDLSPKSRDQLAFKLRDRLQLLNSPISEDTLPERDNAVVPLTFGECSNVSPVLIDGAQLKYKVHNRSVGGIIEVRDKGAPVSFNPQLADGTFTLNQSPFGQVTCSVHGDSVGGYSDTIGSIIRTIATQYGNSRARFSNSEIDSHSFSLFETENQQCVGKYIESKTNTLAVLSELAGSVGAGLTVSREGKLKIVQLKAPIAPVDMALTEFDIVEGTLQQSDRLEVRPSVKIGYNLNCTPQTDLATGLPEDHQAVFKEPIKYVSSVNSSAVEVYKYFDDPEPVNTSLQVRSEAQAESDRRLNILGVQRNVYKFKGFSKCLTLEIGDTVSITHRRYDIPAAVVLSVAPNWVQKTCDVEVFA